MAERGSRVEQSCRRPELVLASRSSARRLLLQRAGLDFVVEPARVDEDDIRRRAAGAAPEDLARELARAKAAEVHGRLSSGELRHIILGADQLLELDGRILTKPASLDHAREQLLTLRGRWHRLISAVVARCSRGGEIWTCVSEARLKMREFSIPFLDSYMHMVGDDVLDAVGCYHVEGVGIQLFERIEGDWFTILGLPMLQLLEFLRREGVVEA